MKSPQEKEIQNPTTAANKPEDNSKLPIKMEPKKLEYGRGVYVVVTRDEGKAYNNLDNLRMSLVENGVEKEYVPVVSGQARIQEYKKRNSPGPNNSFRPLPEGKYNLGPGKPDNQDGIAPLFFPIFPDPVPRGAFGVHLDENRFEGYPGTAGCVGIPDKGKLEVFKKWMNNEKPKVIFIDWGLGTFTQTTGSPLSLLADVTNYLGFSKSDSVAINVNETVEPLDIEYTESSVSKYDASQGEILN